MDLLATNQPIEKLYFIRRPHDIDIDKDIECSIVKKETMDKMTTQNHQGFIAAIKKFEYYDLECIFRDNPQNVLILDHIQDPQNLGSIMRTVNGAGWRHIIIPKNRSASVNDTVLRVASGGHIGIKVIKVNSLVSAIQKMKNNNFWVYATSLEDAIDIKELKEFNKPCALVLGNESKGVSKTILNLSDQNIKIPMHGTVQSLNVSVAAAILLFLGK